jgi:hypothetical protein
MAASENVLFQELQYLPPSLSTVIISPEDCELPVKSPPAGVWVLTERVDLRRSASGARWPSGVAWYAWNYNTIIG